MRKTILLTIFITMLLDQLSKYWVVVEKAVQPHEPIIINKFFSIVMVWNHGVSFGMLASPGSSYSSYILIAVALMISAVLWRIAHASESKLEVIAYGMIIGGALGNALDRIRLGAVADFLYVHYNQLGWPAFNIADSAICIGVGFLLLHMLKNSKVAP